MTASHDASTVLNHQFVVAPPLVPTAKPRQIEILSRTPEAIGSLSRPIEYGKIADYYWGFAI